jgi:Zn-dependent protease
MHDPITRIIVGLPLFLLAIVLHELAHGYVAYLLGDDTAKRAGRLTLSPLAHLDVLGTLCFIISSLASFGFGWAKPVPISVDRLRNPWRDEILVTLAGPGANFVQAAIWALLARLMLAPAIGRSMSGSLLEALVTFFVLGVLLNLVLMVFNLLPIPPLDGSHVAIRLLGIKDPFLIGRLAPLGMIVLLLVISTSAFDVVSRAVVYPLAGLLVGIPI